MAFSDISEEFTVAPEIKQVSHYLNQAKRVAIRSIKPILSEDLQVQGLNIKVEGPEKHVSYFGQLMQNAKLTLPKNA